MPSVDDFPNRAWSKFFSLFFGPLYFEPPRPPEPTPTPVTGARGGIVTRIGDQREGNSVRLVI